MAVTGLASLGLVVGGESEGRSQGIWKQRPTRRSVVASTGAKWTWSSAPLRPWKSRCRLLRL